MILGALGTQSSSVRKQKSLIVLLVLLSITLSVRGTDLVYKLFCNGYMQTEQWDEILVLQDRQYSWAH